MMTEAKRKREGYGLEEIRQKQSGQFAVFIVSVLVAALTLVRSQEFYVGTTVAIFLLVASIAWWRPVAWMLLLFVQAYLFVLEPREEVGVVTMIGLPFVTLLMLQQAFHFETLRSLKSVAIPTDSTRIASSQFQSAMPGTGWFAAMKPERILWTTLAQLTSAILAILLAQFLLSFFPLNYEARRDFRLLPEGLRTIALAIVMALTFFFVKAILSEWTWRMLSKPQASVFLRGVLVGWLDADANAVQRQRQKIQRKIRKRNQKAAKTEGRRWFRRKK